MRFLGIDPGLATIGIGMIESSTGSDIRVHEWLTITTPAGMALQDRLCEIDRDLTAIVQEFQPDHAVVEKLFFATNEKTALDVAHARGVILNVLGKLAIPCMEPTPLQMKLGITGDGSADKLQVQTMLMHMLKLREIPRPDDAADALALACYGAMHAESALVQKGVVRRHGG